MMNSSYIGNSTFAPFPNDNSGDYPYYYQPGYVYYSGYAFYIVLLFLFVILMPLAVIMVTYIRSYIYP